MPPIHPDTLRRQLLEWYAVNRRRLPWRETSDPYAIWVSEVMLQQTQVATAIPYYLRFMQRFPTTRRLAEADGQEVLKLWEGLGYYSRARNLHRAAGEVIDRFNGRIPDDPEIPLLLNKVYPAHEVVKIDYHLPGCPPSADSIFATLAALLSQEPVELPYELIKYD